ncbi:MAG TPA: pseudouridine synthase [Chitinophagales bacterium]|nr:pseudouridine synthase [Chitinophagales bacterium]
MQKKDSDPDKRPAKKSSIPYSKANKKKKYGIVDAAKKYFEKKDSDKKKKEGKPAFSANGKTPRDFVKKKFSTEKPKKSERPEKGMKPEVFSTEEKITDEIRLNKYLAHAGIASRRNADELIKEGRVKVNGEVVTEMGHKVKPKDKVEFDGKQLNLEKKYYVLLNKPKDFITTVKDERDRRTVMELLRGVYPQIKSKVKPRLYPVGRLDRNTTGVLLVTNDGELAQKLTHPSSQVRKVYHVILDEKLKKEDFDKIAEGGVVLEDGIAEVDEIAYPNPKNRAEVGVEIHTGKNRFIRRLFESLGYEVVKLDRVFFAGLTKKDLPRGRWRFLNEEEVRLLKHFI